MSMLIIMSKIVFTIVYAIIMLSLVSLLMTTMYRSNIFVKGFSNPMIPRMNNIMNTINNICDNNNMHNDYTIPKWVHRKVFEHNKHSTYKTKKYKFEEYDPITSDIDYEIPSWVYKKVFKFNKPNYHKYKS